MIEIMKYLLLSLLILAPSITLAQSGSLQGLITGIGGFINEVLIPFILGIAFLIFLINAVRFFVIGGSSTESQENARNLALYGVGAFVLILSLWGMVNLLAGGIGLDDGNCVNGQSIQSDYIVGGKRCSDVENKQKTKQNIQESNPWGNTPVTNPAPGFGGNSTGNTPVPNPAPAGNAPSTNPAPGF